MDELVLIVDNIEAVYPPGSVSVQKSRWSRVADQFSRRCGSKNLQFIARSPGRVNLLGEHIDYSLYDVLPMGVEEDILVAVSSSNSGTTSPTFRCANTESEKFPSAEFLTSASGDVEIDPKVHEWTNYFKAGLRGAMELMHQKDPGLKPRSMDVLVDGTVPSGGGLSSSAAFVCASALAVLRANGRSDVSKKELVELAIVSERAVGVNSGGMDQAASVFAIRGDALQVSFSPRLHVEAIKFPKTEPEITFMIAQSFVVSDKHVTAPRCYNLRVVECTLAAEVISSMLGLQLKGDAGPLGRSLRGLQHAYFNTDHGSQDKSKGDPNTSAREQLLEMRSLVLTHLHETGYTRDLIAERLEISVSDLEHRYMTKIPVHADRFLLRQRALYVFEEALRVLDFRSILQSPHGHAGSHEVLQQKLGDLMNQTQDACRDLYDCSCPELDELCRIAREAGSYGSRLTGAGWGGCTVHLVPKDKVNSIRSALEQHYYRAKFPDITAEKLKEAIVVSQPGHGSMVVKLK